MVRESGGFLVPRNGGFDQPVPPSKGTESTKTVGIIERSRNPQASRMGSGVDPKSVHAKTVRPENCRFRPDGSLSGCRS
jgi:hypothetical protein